LSIERNFTIENESERNREYEQPCHGERDIDRSLDDAVEALKRNVVDVDDGNAVQILEARAKGDDLEEIGHDLDVDAFPARCLKQLEHPHVLVRRQRDIQVIDRFPRRNFHRIVDRAQQRKAAVAEMIAGGSVVDKSDDLVPQFAVLEDLVRHETAEFTRTSDENPLQADPGAPPALQHLADQFARRIGQHDVDDEEDGPGGLRHRKGAAVSRLTRRVVGLHERGGEDAEDDRENGADEDGEEVIHARPTAPQSIQALELKSERHEPGDEGQDVEVLTKRRNPLRDGNQAGVESKRVGDDKCRHAEECVGQDVEGDEETVVAVHHDRVLPGRGPVRQPARRVALACLQKDFITGPPSRE
jgi:hypothetical protein